MLGTDSSRLVNAAFVAGLLALAVGSALVLRARSTSGVGQAKSQLELVTKLVVIPVTASGLCKWPPL
jgi:hypothetical protein